LLAQQLFWGRPLCGAKSKELGPTALKQLLIFYAPPQLASISQNSRISLAKTFHPCQLNFYSFLWNTIRVDFLFVADSGCWLLDTG
jgi:hypothetical protein